jgi:hypothetical protein
MLFVNPYQIVSGEPYFFTLLDAVLDARRAKAIAYGERTFDLDAPAGLRAFRQAAKASLCGMSENEALEHVRELATRLSASEIDIPEHAQALTVADLVALRDAGVAIENHGWSHLEIGHLDPAAVCAHIARGADWIGSVTGARPAHYAVPFGMSEVPPESASLVEGTIFLANPELPPGGLPSGCWNRHDFTHALQKIQ